YQPNLLVSTTAGVTANVTRRSSVEVSGSWSEQRFVSADLGAIRQYGARARYIHRLTRTLGFHLGYGRVEGRYPGALGGPPVAVDTIDVGLDYGDRIALGRRAVLSFNTALASERYGGATHYRLNGSATLTKGLGRTWTASTGYTRNTEFLIGFPQPISTDSGTADLSGQIAPRVQVRAGVALSRGELAFGGSEALMAYSGASRLTIAASRTLGVFVQYGYYRYDIPAGWAAVPLPARFGRQTAMAGLAAWVPIVKQEKTRRGPR